jgi:hypothetical protein
MKIRMTVEVEIKFDLESDGEVLSEENVIDSDIVGDAVVKAIKNSIDDDYLVDAISERCGWCIQSLNISIPEAECVDYLD